MNIANLIPQVEEALSSGGLIGTVAAAGSAQASATELTYTLNKVTGADGTKGVKLKGAKGTIIAIHNSTSGQDLKVYPPTDGTIGGKSANASVTMPGLTSGLFVCNDGVNWISFYKDVAYA